MFKMDLIEFNDLIKLSPWVNRILGFEKYKIKKKNKVDILREYDVDKWGSVLNNSQTNFSLNSMDTIFEEFNSKIPFYYKNLFYNASGYEILQKHLDFYEACISEELDGASAVVELGAGYGSKILNLSKRNIFNNKDLYAAELSDSGCLLMEKVAKTENIDLFVGKCDLSELILDKINIPENSIIFTSYALHYVNNLDTNFINFIRAFNPKAVFHFEPCYDHYSKSNFHGLMCKRYIELNDYNKNMLSIFNADKNIELTTIKNFLGFNPFLPISMIKWKSYLS